MKHRLTQRLPLETPELHPIKLTLKKWIKNDRRGIKTCFDPSLGRIKVEEMIVITKNGVQILNAIPSKDMMVAHPFLMAE